MRDKPLTVKPVTEEEVQRLGFSGPRAYAWQFPEDIFNGEWWAIEVPNNKISSATNSFRNQAQTTYRTKASIRKATDGRVFVRRLVDEPYEHEPRKGQKK